MVTQGADFFAKTYVLERGDPDQKLEEAKLGFLRALMRSPDGEKRWLVSPPAGWRTSYRRTALAHWLTDVEYGAGQLLARVVVNRLWQHHLGRGIVSTPNDFGFQGERPTHPELLEWLAAELVRSGWSLKHLHRLILGSQVYILSSRRDDEKMAVDPQNSLLWRRAPRRLEAEAIRDSLLRVSGLLDERMFGPGTLDEAGSRRSVYLTIKRSQLIPMMQLFDAPESLVSLGERPSTTVAPQALMFLNHAAVRRWARAFAERIAPDRGDSLEEAPEEAPGKGIEEAIVRGYRIAVSRRPSRPELDESLAFVRDQIQTYRREGAADAGTLALADFCQVLMSLSEFIYVD